MQNPTTGASRPEASEYDPYYAEYIAQIPDGPILETLATQIRATQALLSGVDEARALRRYAPGKWSLKEVVGHIVDTERLYAMRALAFARCERARLFGMEQDEWVAAAGFDARPLPDLLAEFESLRRANLAMFSGFRDDVWMRRGIANEVEFSVRALAWIIAGHERHHVKVIRERYLSGAAR
jgi:hypothetical protein